MEEAAVRGAMISVHSPEAVETIHGVSPLNRDRSRPTTTVSPAHSPALRMFQRKFATIRLRHLLAHANTHSSSSKMLGGGRWHNWSVHSVSKRPETAFCCGWRAAVCMESSRDEHGGDLDYRSLQHDLLLLCGTTSGRREAPESFVQKVGSSLTLWKLPDVMSCHFMSPSLKNESCPIDSIFKQIRFLK